MGVTKYRFEAGEEQGRPGLGIGWYMEKSAGSKPLLKTLQSKTLQ